MSGSNPSGHGGHAASLDVPALLAALPSRIAAIPAMLAVRDPRHVALIEDARSLTNAQLAQAVDETAARLHGWGVRGGDRVMIVAENCIAQVVLLFAAARLDAWALVSNARLSAAELDAIRAHAQPRVVAFTTRASPDAAQHAARLGAEPAQMPKPDAGVNVNPVANAGRDARGETRGVDRSVHSNGPDDAAPNDTRARAGGKDVDIGAWSWLHDPTVAAEPVEAAAERQCAALIYTTGTTGAPKGVMLSHRNLLFIAAVSSTLRRVGHDDVVYAVLPISHVYGLASVCLGSLYAGATLRLAPRFAPEAVRRALADERVSIFQGVPAMHAKLLDHLQTKSLAWSAPHLRFAYSGGSPLDAALKARVERAYGVVLHNGYGMTESSPTVAQTMLDAPRTDCSVGEAIPGIEVRFVSPGDSADGCQDTGAASSATHAPDGEVGELWVRGPNVMLGYYRNPALTRATVTQDGWLKTGDLGRRDPDGALHIVGRSKELIIRSGFNVYPAEVEQVLNAHPDVVQSAVIGRAVEGNEEVIAFVELAGGASADVDALHTWCRERLAPYKQPADIRVLTTLPAASTGKILKHQLRAML